MKIAPAPVTEDERLASLLNYNVLDTPPEEAFDEITRLASSICDAPVSLVSLIDEERQWFKSKVGLPEEVSETPRDVSFCSHAILEDQLFEVPNVDQDERFRDNPLATDMGIKFYAGMPLATPSGQNIGTLCVIDQKPKQLTEDQRNAMKTLAKQVIKQMELSLKVKEIAIQNQKLKQEEKVAKSQNRKLMESIRYAQRVQRGMLSKVQNLKKEVPESFVMLKPKDIVSGDFFYYNHVLGKHIIAAADCTGHGVGGALLTIMSHELLEEITSRRGITDPDLILTELHQRFLSNIEEDNDSDRADALDISLCVIDPADKKVRFSGAKNHMVYFDECNEMRIARADRICIGDSRQVASQFTVTEIPYTKNMGFYMFSDGFPDQFGGPNNRKFGRKSLKQFLQTMTHEGMDTQMKRLNEKFNEWKGEQNQIDDVIVMGFRPSSIK